MNITRIILRETCLAAAGVAFIVAVALFSGGAAHAAPLRPDQPCIGNAFQQYDMAGIYESRYVRVIMLPCGTVRVSWINDYGEHHALYYSEDRIPSGGVVAYGYQPDQNIGAYLDAVVTLLIKPAEPGWIQVATITDADTIRRVYRLQKVG